LASRRGRRSGSERSSSAVVHEILSQHAEPQRDRFQSKIFGDAEAVAVDHGVDDRPGGGGNGGGGAGDLRDGDAAGAGEDEQFALFSKIVREYVVDGAPNEINIR